MWGRWAVAIETLKMTSEVRAVRVEHARHTPARRVRHKIGQKSLGLNRKVLFYRSSATVCCSCVTVDVGREPDGSRAPLGTTRVAQVILEYL